MSVLLWLVVIPEGDTIWSKNETLCLQRMNLEGCSLSPTSRIRSNSLTKFKIN